MARVVGVIWVSREAVYFCNRDWTGQIMLKPLQKINFPRISNFARRAKTKGMCDHVLGSQMYAST
jgi:hypothetical protein